MSLDHVAYKSFASIYKAFRQTGDVAELPAGVEKDATPPGHDKLL
jgi:transcriptional regulator NrdR family protein